MIKITSKEVFEALPEKIQWELRDVWSGEVDVETTVECFTCPQIPFVRLEELLGYDLSYRGGSASADSDVDIPVAFVHYYNRLKRYDPALYCRVAHHYSMFTGLFARYSVTARDGCFVNIIDTEWGHREPELPSLRDFMNGFFEFIEDAIKEWSDYLTRSLMEEAEYYRSDEYIIENIIANEVEVDYEN